MVLLFPLTMAAIAAAATPTHEIKLATLAPENSSLMQIFKEMNIELLKETNNQVGFKIFAGFVLGDELDVLRKLRFGVVQAGTFTDTTLTNVNVDVRVLQVPFLFKSYREVDYVMDKLGGYFKEGFAKAGYEVLGWTELGFLYLMSTVPVDSVADLKGLKVWTRAESPMANALFARAGVSPVTVTAPDVLMALQTNLLEVVYNSPYYALLTQWYSRVGYLTDIPLAYIGGALIIDGKVYSLLGPNLQASLKKVCAKHLRRLTDKTRKDNEEALRIILQRGVQKVTPEPREVDHFKAVVDEALGDVDPKYLPRESLQKVRDEIAKYRSRRGGSP
ncbi:MAG TPA: TRAP transporter substrate-binding protein DctP [Syntrophobacteria bacterium]|nr:TRAP transporter substrate-binding protein DctP [Syntrophobacteria bacterium]